MKKAIARLGALHMSLVGLAVTLLPSLAHAQETAEAMKSQGGLLALAMAIGIGLAALGGALAQAKAAAAALEGVTRNPNAASQVFTPLILSLAFIESLVLFTWVLMFLVHLKF